MDTVIIGSPDDFEEKLRKAAGIQTKAERKAELEMRAHQTAEWERHAPLRERALLRYRTVIAPLINETLISARKIARESSPPYEILEETSTPASDAFLARRTFHLQQIAPTGMQQRGRPADPPFIVATLHIGLRADQSLELGIQEKGCIQITPPGISVERIALADIQDRFITLLGRLKR